MDLSKADEKLIEVFRRAGELPSLPAIISKVAAMPEDANHRQLEELISSDQGLASKVLKVVNSVCSSLRSPTCSLPHAASILGPRKLKTLALSVPSTGLYRSGYDGLAPLLLWRHSLVVALASQRIAAAVLPSRAQDMYVAGLLHDIGISLFLHNLPERYCRILGRARHDEALLSGLEASCLGATHAELGYALASKCRLSALVCECIRCHDTPDTGNCSRSDEVSVAVSLLQFVDRWAQDAGYSALSSTKPRCPTRKDAPGWFSSTGRDLAGILESVRRDVIVRELELLGTFSSRSRPSKPSSDR